MQARRRLEALRSAKHARLVTAVDGMSGWVVGEGTDDHKPNDAAEKVRIESFDVQSAAEGSLCSTVLSSEVGERRDGACVASPGERLTRGGSVERLRQAGGQ